MNNNRFDIAIIGCGPAGVSAAITAKIRNKTVLLIGDEISSKVEKAQEIKNYPGLPDIRGDALAGAFISHLEKMEIEITKKRVSTVYAMGDYFAIQADEEMLEAKSVILATGIVTGKSIPGEDELLGRGVSYCATCDASLYRGKSVIVVGYSKKEEEEAAFLSEVCSDVTYIPIYKDETDLPDTVRVVREQVKEIRSEGDKRIVVTSESEYTTDGVFVLRDAIAPDRLVPGLETDGGHIVVDRHMQTNLDGVFACGDITGTPYQYIKAAGEGNVAALSAVNYLS
ncbi:MAG: NAD(P)/FAD-dependent oxidoreductase [Eubacterium sp.]|nr:NAD(P)/FAD-dependent oxidoreductase [Eubacterium sp.]